MAKKIKISAKKNNNLKKGREENFFKMAFFRQQLEAMKKLGGELILQEG
ncbi:hypothetical protein KBI33_03845 [Candidatus Shapirobacteria bacterium]|nr:hypothetical protein [Candidatus Shapirobacteria bacterium]